jgi:hypothetical protein
MDQMIRKLRRMPKRRRDALEKYVMAIMNGAPLDAGGWEYYREKLKKWGDADKRSKLKRYIAAKFARGNLRLVAGGKRTEV